MSMFLTSLSTDSTRPSLFELIAQDRLMTGLQPAFKYLIQKLCENRPRLWGFIKYNHEFYYFLMYFLEKHYLWQYDGSFSECFYGLRRASVLNREHEKKVKTLFADVDRKNALIQLILIPYIRGKIEKLYEKLNEEDDEAQEEEGDLRRWLKRIFVASYPYIHALYEGIFFLFQLAYLFEKTVYYSPFLWLFNQKCQRLTRDDLVEQQKRSQARARSHRLFGPFRTVGFLPRVVEVLSRISYLCANYAKIGILLFVFGYRLSEWFWSAESQMQGQRDLPVPSPPGPAPAAADGIRLPKSKKLCPLCREVRINPACDSSGYVYCYRCIFDYVEQHQRSPITFAPCSSVRKIYDS